MELDERKVKILNAVIKNYLETGEPVGSRTISKESDLKLSSATIRNEMADLEEMGYIIQPHTSSGRIPTDAGYRLYVDNMMKEKIEELDKKEKDLNEVKDYLTGKVEQVEELLQNTAKLLANNTNYATMVTTPIHKKGKKLKFIQLSLLEEDKLLCVIVVEGNVIKNKIIDIVDTVSSETILKLNILFNTSLNGLSLEEMNISLVSMMTAQAPEYSELVRQIIDVVGHALANENDFKIYTSGATNIFKYPELSESSTASEIINTFEEKKLLTNLLVDKNGDEEQSGIQVYIGNETPVSSMKDCSVVTATYEIEDGVTGTIGIIGPKRMDYEKVVKALKSVTDELDDKLGNHDK
ncbi:MAG: heat-inducible transcription repressor HrcA [Lachnospiraceae bacterium]|nr:heat-inducible transcription repressor HrcA [Lachnospiraceae bacterium]